MLLVIAYRGRGLIYSDTTTDGTRMVRRSAAYIHMRAIESQPQSKSQPRKEAT